MPKKQEFVKWTIIISVILVMYFIKTLLSPDKVLSYVFDTYALRENIQKTHGSFPIKMTDNINWQDARFNEDINKIQFFYTYYGDRVFEDEEIDLLLQMLKTELNSPEMFTATCKALSENKYEAYLLNQYNIQFIFNIDFLTETPPFIVEFSKSICAQHGVNILI